MKSALDIIQDCLVTGNKSLNLYNYGLTNNSPEIELLQNCNHITSLDLDNNNLDKVIELNMFTKLKKLDFLTREDT